MREVPLADSPAAAEFARRLGGGELDVAIFLTGVGTRFLFEAIASSLSGERLATAEGLALAREHLARLLPGLRDAPVTETRVCQYENTPNGDFLIDRHPDFENVWLVGGGSGHGFKHGPALGEYVADRVTQADTELEPRFTLNSESKARQRLVY